LAHDSKLAETQCARLGRGILVALFRPWSDAIPHDSVADGRIVGSRDAERARVEHAVHQVREAKEAAEALQAEAEEARAIAAVERHDRAAAVAVRAAEAPRQVEADRKGRGLVARLRAAWRGE
jgi:hypothetical protein